ncbi:ATP-binding protein [Ascidiimonas aurantiaca]|uniref:ATP-binding protein n=1 Tax=Ascidiimonas aurantiaca TaxID=1685432 RepID=UPI0030EEB8E8
MEVTTKNTAKVLGEEIRWFEKVVDTRLTLYFKNESDHACVFEHAPPQFDGQVCPYAGFVKNRTLDFTERLVLVLALLPHIKPQSLDVFLIRNQNLNSEFSEFGGIRDTAKAGFFPTMETACFIVCGDDLDKRFAFMKQFHPNHMFFRKGILVRDTEQETSLQSRLVISHEYMGLFTTGKKHLPEYSARFPAKKIMTELEWESLVVDDHVMEDLKEIKEWLIHSETILDHWHLRKNLKSGFRALFYGPPGTGKTLAATLLGKETGRPVFRVDLSQLVSKYIGETEKNLGQLFDEAENKEWILFFDEADALFGKRTQTRGANDRYANQEIAYLLQRIEDFSGLVILATNIHTNIDEAFSRRFQSMIYFPKPGVEQRALLWKNLFTDTFEMEENVDIQMLSEKYELSGGEMINVLRYCALEAAKRNEKILKLTDIVTGIRREYRKSNKTL